MALDTIPKQEGGKLKAVASGTLPSGQPVVVNSDGTVSVITEDSRDQAVGSNTTVVPSYPYAADYYASAYDANAQKVVFVYRDESLQQRAKAVVGTVSGTSISFGTPVEFGPGTSVLWFAVTYDANAQKIVVAYSPSTNSYYGYARVGTVSGTSISFGTATVFHSSYTDYTSITYDANAQKVVIAFRDAGGNNYGRAIVGTVSGTSISFGSYINFETTNVQGITVVHDTAAQKNVVFYKNSSLRAKVLTVSGTSISAGAETNTVLGVTSDFINATYDAASQKVVAVFANNENDTAAGIVGTVSGTSISFGSAVSFQTGQLTSGGQGHLPLAVTYGQTSQKIVVICRDVSNSNYGTVYVGTVSGTSISFESGVAINSVITDTCSATYDVNSESAVLFYRNDTNSDRAEAVVFQPAYTSTNLTSENYIGMSGGAIDSEVISQALGSAVVFESAAVGSNVASTFDSNSNKVVIVYQDTANSFYGTAIVGTVSGTSISFGSPVVFSSANRTQEIQITFDSNSNKVVVAYDDRADGQKGKAIVGTVSGTSISFGSAVVFNNGSTDTGTPNAITFDSNSNKVVIAFQDKADTNKGKAIVGTVSGTSISFGSEATFLNADYATHVSATFDSNSNKVVIVYKDGSNSTHGYAVVGTVSGTSISFGTPVVFEAAATNNPNVSFDTVNNKIVIAYADGTVGTAIVGTVSGESISFGSPVIFNSTETTSPRVRFDATAGKMVIAYGEGASNVGTFKTGTVNGTSISFDSATVFESGATNAQNGLVYDSNAGKMVLSYYSGSNSGYGTSKVLQTGYINITRGEVADGDTATIDIVGTVSSNQLSLTPGQQYYVQTDGTVGTTPADPSVLAGTAVSATKMVVKS